MILRLNHTSPLKVHQGSENSNMLGLALGVRDFSNHLILKKEHLEPKISLKGQVNSSAAFYAPKMSHQSSEHSRKLPGGPVVLRPWSGTLTLLDPGTSDFPERVAERLDSITSKNQERQLSQTLNPGVHISLLSTNMKIYTQKKHSPHKQVRCYLRAILAISVTNICSGITRH